jgi:hypothetical protein
MTYLAAAGDGAVGVEWPSVSTHVVAVGGTSLSYDGTNPRSETVWSDTGGGISAYVAAPAYQKDAVAGLGTPTQREVSDVSFNADPNTGQYVAIIGQGSTTVGWMDIGGTSLSTPQWAGIVAVANAMRAQNSLAALGDAHAAIYQIGVQGSSYRSAFLDVTSGANGSCATCSAGVGYDLPSGLGSPNVTTLFANIGATPHSVGPPVVTSSTVAGKYGSALYFTVTASGEHALTYSLSNAPAGMSIAAATGVVSWASPVAGTYTVTAIATDPTDQSSGTGTLTVTITEPPDPVVFSDNISGAAGSAITYAVQIQAVDSVTYSLVGAPSGMSISNAGVLTWDNPVVGSFTVTVVVTDQLTGLPGSGPLYFSIFTPSPPAVTAQTINAPAGTALSYQVSVSSSDLLNYAISGAPAGMAISTYGQVSWPQPIAGSYGVTLTVTDEDNGLSTQVSMTVNIVTPGPAITAPALSGTVGTALSGTLGFADPTSTSLQVTVSGIPSGMSFTVIGSTLAVSWSSPLAGSYTLNVKAVDGKGLSATSSFGVSIQ